MAIFDFVVVIQTLRDVRRKKKKTLSLYTSGSCNAVWGKERQLLQKKKEKRLSYKCDIVTGFLTPA